MQHKIVGYLLVCIGILCMLFSTVSMYQVFVMQKSVVTIIQLTDLNLTTKCGEMAFPLGDFNPIINLALFTTFMLFLILVGGSISTLGCRLLKIERIHDALVQAGSSVTKEQLKQLKDDL